MLSSANLSIEDAVATQDSGAIRSPRLAATFVVLDEKFGIDSGVIDKADANGEKFMLSLASSVGHLVSQFYCGKFENNNELLTTHIDAVLKGLVEVASASDVLMQDVAEKNVAKIADRWPQKRSYRDNFDSEFHDDEKFPDQFIIEIFEKTVDGKTYVYQRCGDVFIGDRLTDNKINEDDYRFHDVFHYSYAAVLSWSPVLRRLLKRKRKSDHEIDEAEDGARAAIIEEGVVAWIFSQASKLDYFEGVKCGGLQFRLLKQVREFTTGYEVDELPLWQWEEAILQGYDAFRFLQKHRSAKLTINTAKHSLTYEKLL